MKSDVHRFAVRKERSGKDFLRFVVACCVFLLCLFFFLFLSRCFVQYVLVDLFGVSKEQPLVEMLLKEREKNAIEEDRDPIRAEDGWISALRHVQNALTRRTSAFERLVEDYTIGRDTVVYVVNRAESMLDFRLGSMEEESIVAMEDGYMIELEDLKTDEAIRAAADVLVDLRDVLAEREIPFVYAKRLPRACTETDWVCGTLDFSQENILAERSYLLSKRVDVLALEEALHAQGLDHHSLFYKTDHHWNAWAGLWAADRIAAYAQEQYGVSFDRAVLVPERYRTERLEEIFLGSYGRRVTLAKTSLEDFELVYPLFETDIAFWQHREQDAARGDFSILYHMPYLETNQASNNLLYQSKPYSSLCYAVYFCGDVGISGIKNHNNPNGPRILLIGDSYDNVIAPFLALAASETVVVDPRQTDKQSFMTQVLSESFDLAICTINAGLDRIVEETQVGQP